MLLHFFSFHTNQKFYEVYYTAALPFKFFDEMIYKRSFQKVFRECVSKGAAGARTHRSLGHHLLHPQILRLLVLCAPADLWPRALFYRTDCTRRSKILTHALHCTLFFCSSYIQSTCVTNERSVHYNLLRQKLNLSMTM